VVGVAEAPHHEEQVRAIGRFNADMAGHEDVRELRAVRRVGGLGAERVALPV